MNSQNTISVSSVNNSAPLVNPMTIQTQQENALLLRRDDKNRPESKKAFVDRCKALAIPRSQAEREFYNQLNTLGLREALVADAQIRQNGLTLAKSIKPRFDKTGKLVSLQITYVAPRAPKMGKLSAMEAEIAELKRLLAAKA